jgi:arylsulfatase A-like enzyme
MELLTVALAVAVLAAPASPAAVAAPMRPPNVIVVITDDQGYGDLGIHGNPVLRTPNLDRFARESVRLKNFYVSPVCSPTRASLLTGRYNYRTGIVDTYLGRSLMDPGEITLAERLARSGYRTGIFGKWHLGDNLPLRPIDRGFQHALVLKGGGIGQPSDLPGGSHYLDPVLLQNGQPRKYSGYCSDVFTTAAIEFLTGAADQPFFLYLAFNCPHDPLEAPEAELGRYLKEKLGPDRFPQAGAPLPPKLDEEKIARVYAMVSNIDANVGRLLQAVADRGLADSTIVVFLTDNGPAFARFNAGLRGLKGSTYEGGIHVPCYIRWPGKFPAGHEVNQIAAHIDLAPTMLEACGVDVGTGPKLDGRSLLPLLRGEKVAWPDRTLCFQWHRGDVPEFGRSFAARRGRFKLLRPERPTIPPPPLELYDLEQDLFEQHDLAAASTEIVSRMYHDYLDWFRDVCGARGFGPIRILIGDQRENPVVLTRQDWHLLDEYNPALGGFWELNVARAGRFEIGLHLRPSDSAGRSHIRIQEQELSQPVAAGAEHVVIRGVGLNQGPARLHAWLEAVQPANRLLDAELKWTGDN